MQVIRPVFAFVLGLAVQMTYLDFLRPFLPFIWFGILCYATVELLFIEAVRRRLTCWKDRQAKAFYPAALVIAGVLLVAWWQLAGMLSAAEQEKEIAVVTSFKASPALTEARKHRLTKGLDEYYVYLRQVGFELPKEIPPIEVGPTDLIMAGGSPTGLIETVRIMIPEKPKDEASDRANLLTGYSHYTFNRLLDIKPHTYEASAAWIYACYYRSSFTKDRDVCGGILENWRNALWELQRVQGREYTDQLLFRSLRLWRVSPPTRELGFDAFFTNKLQGGLYVVDVSPAGQQKFRNILTANGIRQQ